MTIIKVWIAWDVLLEGYTPSAGPNYVDMWNFLNASEKIKRLDRQIAAINADRRYAVLTMYPTTPAFARAGAPNTFAQESRYEFASSYALDSTWAWFIGYLFARYKFGAGVHDGPANPNWWGNPSGAWVAYIEPLNEPNYMHWPQADAVCKTVTAIQTAHDLSFYWAGNTCPYPVVPATADCGHGAPVASAVGPNGPYTAVKWTEYADFTSGVLSNLNGWHPAKVVFWSHHNYTDVRDSYPSGVQPRVDNVASMLASFAWAGDPSRPRLVLLTEGGLPLKGYLEQETLDVSPEGEADQQRNVPRNMSAATGSAVVPWWTNHIVNDAAGNMTTWHSGLRRNWNSGTASPGAKRPVYADFQAYYADPGLTP